jgi:hypothetical protein
MLKAEELDLGIDPSLLDDPPVPSATSNIKSKKDLLQELRFKQVGPQHNTPTQPNTTNTTKHN